MALPALAKQAVAGGVLLTLHLVNSFFASLSTLEDSTALSPCEQFRASGWARGQLATLLPHSHGGGGDRSAQLWGRKAFRAFCPLYLYALQDEIGNKDFILIAGNKVST